MKINYLIMIVLISSSFSLFASSCPCNRVYETVGNAHPFSTQDADGRDRHAIMLHIDGKLPNSTESHNIWFLIKSIKETNIQINTLETNHTTKKLLYAQKTQSLQLVGYKLTNSDPTVEWDKLTKNEISQTITPRTILFAELGESQYTQGFNTDKMLLENNNETKHFCETLQKRYKAKRIVMTLKRFYPDRCGAKHKNPNTDNFPTTLYDMDVYLDLSQLPRLAQRKASSNQPETTSSKNPSPTQNLSESNQSRESSFFTLNKIIAISFASLGTILLLNHFFEINIHIKLRQ